LVATWNLWEGTPTGLTVEMIRPAMAAFEDAMRPAPMEFFAVKVCEMLDAGAALGRIERKTVEEKTIVVRLYREALGDLPADLLEIGITKAIAAWQYLGVPQSDAIRNQVSGELSRRRVERDKLAMALSKLPKPRPVSNGPKYDTSALLADLRKIPDAPDGKTTLDDWTKPAAVKPCRRGLPPLADFVGAKQGAKERVA
jgi:hypothetical protein